MFSIKRMVVRYRSNRLKKRLQKCLNELERYNICPITGNRVRSKRALQHHLEKALKNFLAPRKAHVIYSKPSDFTPCEPERKVLTEAEVEEIREIEASLRMSTYMDEKFLNSLKAGEIPKIEVPNYAKAGPDLNRANLGGIPHECGWKPELVSGDEDNSECTIEDLINAKLAETKNALAGGVPGL